MTLLQKNTYTKHEAAAWTYPNYWDFVALCLVFGVIFLLAWAALQMRSPFQLGEQIPISLDPRNLPGYALRSVFRMLIAMGCSLLFTFTFATLAAKSKHAARIIIPMIDILQSIPILGFLAITVAGFIALFPGSLLGPECAAIFVIFTSQAWNMALSFYQSLRTVPHDLKEAASMFRLSGWQRFWKIDAPFAMPGLLWNMMMSMSASWFFVVASEAISVNNQHITLPGIGSYIAVAIEQRDMHAVLYAIIAMFIVILLYDQVLFRPLIYWAEKFKAEEATDERVQRSWVVSIFQQTRFFRSVAWMFDRAWDVFINIPLFRPKPIIESVIKRKQAVNRVLLYVWYVFLFCTVAVAIIGLLSFFYKTLTLEDVWRVVYLGFITGAKVMVLIVLCSIIWVPVGVWVGSRPRVAEFVQPIVQILAAFPANLLFPVVVILIVKYHLNVNIWTAPLMVLGTQWYILFNVIAGASTIPKDIRQAVSLFHVKGWLRWKRFIIPSIFPFFVTGAITAAGGAWNASVLAEAVSWGSTHLNATGLGAYISHFSAVGNFPKLALGIVGMCIYVLLINHFVWKRLYKIAEERYQIT